jgi:hypothetical protein
VAIIEINKSAKLIMKISIYILMDHPEIGKMMYVLFTEKIDKDDETIKAMRIEQISHERFFSRLLKIFSFFFLIPIF